LSDIMLLWLVVELKFIMIALKKNSPKKGLV
jgi:hypothetical protein